MAFIERLKNLFRSREAKESEKDSHLQQRLDSIDDTLRRIRSYERRQGQLLDSLQRDVSAKLDAALKDKESLLPYNALCDFATQFAMYYERLGTGQDRTLDHIWQSFQTMLQEMGMELIFDRNQPFDDSRHRSCDLRSREDLPNGSVVEVIRPGIIIHGRLQRPADVVVNKTPDSSRQGKA